MFASQTRDLYHIETVRKGGYIEFAVRQIYRAEPSEAYRQSASVDTDAVLVRKIDKVWMNKKSLPLHKGGF